MGGVSTYRVANVGGRNNAGIEEHRQQFNDSIEPEKHDNLFATCKSREKLQLVHLHGHKGSPTAVYLL